MCILDLLLHSKESLFTDNRLWCILSLWPQFVHLTRQNVFSVTLLGIPSITCTWPAFCLYSQAADVSRVCFSSFFLVRKIVNLLFYFSQFDICKIVYSFQLAKNLFLEGCRVEDLEDLWGTGPNLLSHTLKLLPDLLAPDFLPCSALSFWELWKFGEFPFSVPAPFELINRFTIYTHCTWSRWDLQICDSQWGYLRILRSGNQRERNREVWALS